MLQKLASFAASLVSLGTSQASFGSQALSAAGRGKQKHKIHHKGLDATLSTLLDPARLAFAGPKKMAERTEGRSRVFYPT